MRGKLESVTITLSRLVLPGGGNPPVLAHLLPLGCAQWGWRTHRLQCPSARPSLTHPPRRSGCTGLAPLVCGPRLQLAGTSLCVATCCPLTHPSCSKVPPFRSFSLGPRPPSTPSKPFHPGVPPPHLQEFPPAPSLQVF